MKARSQSAWIVLLSCCLLAPPAQASIVARVQAATQARSQARAETPQPDERVNVARALPAPRGNGVLNVADWLNVNDAEGSAPADSSSRRTPQRPARVEPQALPAELHPADGRQVPIDDGSEPDAAVEVVEEQEATVDEDESAAPDDAEPATEDDEPATEDDEPARQEREFSPEMLRLRDKVRTCLTYYYQRPESVAQRSPWGIMHSLVSFGVDSEVIAGNRRVNGIAWICWNRPCRGMKLMYMQGNRLQLREGPGYQGHEGQLLSMLALSRVKATYPLRVDGRELTVADLIDSEKRTCRPRTELTFKLIGLAHYLESDATWTSDDGESWSIPRLIREELAQPIVGAACGGTHRLIGFSMAVKTREKRGESMEGQWLRAKKYVSAYHKYAIKLQNRDGSFSTSWFEKPDNSGNTDRRLQTTGHILEWMVFSLPEEDLTDPRIIKSVNYLANLMLSNRTHQWEIGPQGHALRALALYNERVFGDKPGERRALLARRPGK